MNLSNAQCFSLNDTDATQQRCKRVTCLYQKYKDNFSSYLVKHKYTLRLLLNNSTLQNIKAYEYIYNTHAQQDDNHELALTPLPYKSMRKFSNERDKKEFKRIERNAVMMRRIEYTQKIKENKLQEKYGSNVHCVVYIQKVVRGYFMRKVMECIYVIKCQIQRFVLHIKLYAVISKNRKSKENWNNKRYCGFKGNTLFEKKVQNIIGTGLRENNGKSSSQRLNLSYNYNKFKANRNSNCNIRKKYFNAQTGSASVNDSLLKQNKRKCGNNNGCNSNSNSNTNSNKLSWKCYSLYTSPNRSKQRLSKINHSSNNYQTKNDCSITSDKPKFPDKQSAYKTSNTNKDCIILFQSNSIPNNDNINNDNINVIPSSKSPNEEEEEIHNNISKLPSLNATNANLSHTTNNNHSLCGSNNNNNNIQPQFNAVTSSNSISVEHLSKIKLIQNAYRNYLFHKELNDNTNTTNNKHPMKYSSNIFNFSVNNPSVEVPINPKVNMSSHVQEVNTNHHTIEENSETIPDNYELTQQRADKLFPLFNSIANDISLLYRINKITQTQRHKDKEQSSHCTNDIIENDSEVFN